MCNCALSFFKISSTNGKKIQWLNVKLLLVLQDIKQRLAGGQVFIEFLASPNGDLSQWTNIDRIVDSLAMYWVSTSNHKVSFQLSGFLVLRRV